MKKVICVFASSSDNIDLEYFNAAQELGILIAKNNYDLVYGAGRFGLMYAAASAAKNAGSRVIGVIPEKLIKAGLSWDGCDEFYETPCMATRKQKIRQVASAFIAVPGGFGTLEEIIEVLTLKQLGYHNKPIVFLNTNNFYDGLFSQFEKSYDQKFIKDIYKNFYFIAKTPQEAISFINNYQEVAPVTKW